MRPHLLADSHFSVPIDVAPNTVDLTDWLFTLSDDEYRRCSVAHIAAGSGHTADGRRLSINVEKPSDTLMVQHYIESKSTREACTVVSETDAFTPFGTARWTVTWEVRLDIDSQGVGTFTNHFWVLVGDDFVAMLAEHGIPFEAAVAPAQRTADAHNAEETPLFAQDIARKAGIGLWRR